MSPMLGDPGERPRGSQGYAGIVLLGIALVACGSESDAGPENTRPSERDAALPGIDDEASSMGAASPLGGSEVDCEGGAVLCDRVCVSASRGCPTVIAWGLKNPRGLAVSGGNLYVTSSGIGETDGKVTRVMLTGGDGGDEAITMATGLVDPRAIIADADAVYFATWGDGKIFKLTSDGPPQVVASEQQHPQGLALDATHLYWTNAGLDALDGTIMSMSRTGGMPLALATAQPQPRSLIARNGAVYFASTARSGGGLFVLTPGSDAGTAEVLFSGRVVGVAADDAFVYFASWSPNTNQPFEGSIGRVPLAGRESMPIVPHQSNPSDLVYSDGSLYWTNETGGDAESAPATGGESSVLGPALGTAIAVDEASVYFISASSDMGGIVLRAKR